ncbi:MAG: substrate-binding domain-containing protein [Candidatus Omnitrophota bacterium]|nr:substrate-binding domain-containing protein [Candidatus Omnitrophota bacterium]
MSKGNHTYALVIPRFEDIFHSYYSCEVIKGIGVAASRLKVDVLIHITDRFNHEDWLSSPLLNPDFVNGILFADINGDVATLKKVIERGIPYMVMNNAFEEPINYIAIDNKKAAKQAVQYLIKLGHEKIATISGELMTQAGKARLDGYLEALGENHIPAKEEYLTRGEFLRSPARQSARMLLNLKNRPTAVFAASDVMALELIDVAKRIPIKIPEELSIVGFDDNPLAEYSPVSLTTVSQPLMEMGRLGLENLHQIAQGKARLPVKILLDTKLIERDSCARAIKTQ